MQRILTTIIIAVFITGCSVFKPEPQHTKKVLSAVEIVEILSSDEFEGRKPGSEGFEKAGTFVESYFEEIGVAPYFEGTFRDSVRYFNRTSYNLVGKILAKIPTNDYILIGAHLDHLGKIVSPTDSIYNGANDNASGVGFALQLAHQLKQLDLTRNIILAIFTEEESGMNGARHLAKTLHADSINLLYVMNFDMLSAPLSSDSSNVYITGFSKSNFAEIANSASGFEFVKYESADDAYGLFRAADNYPFYEVFHIPAHTISTYDFKNFAYYHHVRDEYAEINLMHYEKLVETCSEMICVFLRFRTPNPAESGQLFPLKTDTCS
ncbi:MAG: M20/M25/M40 family metallo-hydrolase [Bacteroidales bacterium]|nr:M20/M25/M40 family metallo-hydrolase [Bacteroidales bacterium]